MQMIKSGNVKNVPDDLVEFMGARGWEPAGAYVDEADELDTEDDPEDPDDGDPGDDDPDGDVDEVPDFLSGPDLHDPANTEEQA